MFMTLVNITLEQKEFVNLFLQKHLNYNPAGQKSWDISGSFSNSHRSNPSPHPTNNVERVYPEFFSSFNFV